MHRHGKTWLGDSVAHPRVDLGAQFGSEEPLAAIRNRKIFLPGRVSANINGGKARHSECGHGLTE